MKLYMHPLSMTSRPIRLFLAESGIDLYEQVINFSTGEHLGDAFTAINPNQLVPVLEDGDLRLTECSAILKYLADKFDSPAYPKDLAERAKVNEMMDWFNTNFYRDFGYGVVYPQIFPHQKRDSDEVQQATIAWGKVRVEKWLRVLDSHWLAPNKPYLCGDQVTLADYLGISLLTLGDVVRWDFSPYPNTRRWISNMKQLDSWDEVNEALYSFAAALEDQQFETA